MDLQCPICHTKSNGPGIYAYGTHGSKALDNGVKYFYISCITCQSFHISDIKVNDEYYLKNYNFTGYRPPTSKLIGKLESFFEKYTLSRRQKKIRVFLKDKSRISILDVGCGNGKFLEYLESDIFHKHGIELNKNEYLLSKKNNILVQNMDILSVQFGNKKFDVITMWHVIEHIPDPDALFKKLKSLLKPDGIIVFATPNVSSFGFRIGKAQWFHLDAPRHLILYHEKGVSRLALRYGFKVAEVKSENFEFPLDLFWSSRKSWLFPFIVIGYPLLKCFSKETFTYVLQNKS